MPEAAGLLSPRPAPTGGLRHGVTGGARKDRIYLTGSLVPALERYEQAATGVSDHHALLLTLRTEAAADITPPPPLP